MEEDKENMLGDPLPLASLRLLVPPLQLMSASVWHILKKQDVMNYWKVAEFVSFVMETVPELLLHKHWTQLNLGLRARFILELCRREDPVDPELIQSHLEKIKPQHSTPLGDIKQSEEEEAVGHFLELIQALLKDTQKRQDFYKQTFLEEYGAQYDGDLQILFWEFLCRLDQLLPVPELEQTVSWLSDDECSVFDECIQCVSEPAHMKNLLQHHKQLGHLEQHVPPSSMGDCILSSLSAAPENRPTKPEEQSCTESLSDQLQGFSEETQPVTFVEDVSVEMITVTEYAEVELGATTDIEVMVEEKNDLAENDTVVVLSENVSRDKEEDKITEDKLLNGSENVVINEESEVTQHKLILGPHDCPDCDKKFKFASSLSSHRVIHTGERPHKCSECGRCFSFRQSLERHKNTHQKSAKRCGCVVCGETFVSLSAQTEHKQTHMKDGVFECRQCNRTFSWELALAKHLKTHTDHSGNKATEESNGEKKVEDINEEQQHKTNSECNASESGVIDLRLMNEVISLVKVRTSGRKRRPTMKVQMIDLQKSFGSKRQKETEKVKALELKPVPFNSTEHSYGSAMASSKEGNEGSVLDGPCSVYSCLKCDYSHPEEEQVQQHINETHSVKAEEETPSIQAPPDEQGRYNCPDCDKTFKFKSLLKAHQRIHTGEQPFFCSQCGRRFSFKQSLERHKHTHKSGRRYKCLICGEFFKSLVAQREHKSTHMENGEYICTECGRAFAWKSALVRHLKTHNGDDGKAESLFKCSHCEQEFNCASSLNRHVQTHQEERVHVCNCGKSFAYRAALTAHQRIHQKERPHVCSQCGKGFLYRGGLVSHMKIHSQEMPFMCSYCGKSFKRERNMKKHERCHTRENIFSCSQCDKSFVYKATLTRHELTHSGVRPYLCSDCGKGFFSHAELLKHERFHTGHKPFQCPHCGKKFTQSCYLTIHLRYHTGVRPYSCSECDKSFLSANRLKRHQRTHSGEKPYPCGECGKGFRQSYHLKMHQRTHAIKL